MTEAPTLSAIFTEFRRHIILRKASGPPKCATRVEDAPQKKVKGRKLNPLRTKTYKKMRRGQVTLGTEGGQDLVLESLAKEQGFDGLPQIVSKAEFAKYEKAGERVMFRGINGPKAYTDQFKYGKLYSGTGVAGNGTYMAIGKEAKAMATAYAHTPRPEGQVIKMLLRKNAKVISVKDIGKIKAEMLEAAKLATDKERVALLRRLRQGTISDEKADKLYAALSGKRKRADAVLREMMDDNGRLATSLGYDAIESSDAMIVLNRTALRILR